MNKIHIFRSFLNGLRNAALFSAALAGCLGFASIEEDSHSLEALQAGARKWIDIRLETAALQADWSWEKDLLEATRDALVFRVQRLEAEEALLLEQTASDQEKLDAGLQEVALLQAQLAKQDRHGQEMVKSLQALRPLLPPRLSVSLDLAFKTLAREDLPSGERLQLISTILTRCLQFNNSITYSEEIIPLEGQENGKVMSVLYWGMGQAYALDRVKAEGYVGRPGTACWEWTLAEEAGPHIRKLIDMFHERADPELVSVPIHVDPSRIDR